MSTKKRPEIITGLSITLLSACTSLPSYHEMSCNDLIKKEKSLQQDYALNNISSLLSDIVDIADDTEKSTADANAANLALESNKRELRNIQSVIYQKQCKK